MEVIAHLDWEHVEECIRVNCGNPAAHLVQVSPGPESCLHPYWYAVCSEHTVAAAGGKAHCADCKETLIVMAIRDI
jgi:hypothetical protein